MKILTKFLDIIDNINEWLGNWFSLAIFLLMVVVTYDVVMRYFFNRPTDWGMEVNGFLMLACYLLRGRLYSSAQFTCEG
jgi:TRAP-type mannitol/chloroaromatic compound transport system permease small subunit